MMKNKLKIKRSSLIVLIISIIILYMTSIIFMGLAFSFREDYKKCEEDKLTYYNLSYFECNAFNKMANISKGLINIYINESFSYDGLPNCETLKEGINIK